MQAGIVELWNVAPLFIIHATDPLVLSVSFHYHQNSQSMLATVFYRLKNRSCKSSGMACFTLLHTWLKNEVQKFRIDVMKLCKYVNENCIGYASFFPFLSSFYLFLLCSLFTEWLSYFWMRHTVFHIPNFFLHNIPEKILFYVQNEFRQNLFWIQRNLYSELNLYRFLFWN